jgi:murein DD-endopeptidase MepM/ murein hydrolase activator NlpD
MKVKLNTGKEFVITSGYGDIDSAHSTPHTGIDLAMNLGEPILSPVKGIVSRIVDYGSQNIGKGVMVKLDNGQELIFGHLSEIHVKKGQLVSVGRKLGEAGSSGRSTGPHLHLGLKNTDGFFADPSLYERLFQKVYAMPHVEMSPQKITLSMDQVIYLTPEQLTLLDQVQRSVQTLFN